MRPIKSMIEFKQIIGRGTRLYEGKIFTIYDFMDAYKHFADPEWVASQSSRCRSSREGRVVTVRLIRHLHPRPKNRNQVGRWKGTGVPTHGCEVFLECRQQTNLCGRVSKNLYCALPGFFPSEDELRKLWSNPMTRRTLSEKLADAGFGAGELTTLQQSINAEKSDLFNSNTLPTPPQR
jgi:type I restriction enzyme, R subunit